MVCFCLRFGSLVTGLSFAKEPTVPRSNPPLFMLSFAKEPTMENEFCEEKGPREPRFPFMSFISSAKDTVDKGGSLSDDKVSKKSLQRNTSVSPFAVKEGPREPWLGSLI